MYYDADVVEVRYIDETGCVGHGRNERAEV